MSDARGSGLRRGRTARRRTISEASEPARGGGLEYALSGASPVSQAISFSSCLIESDWTISSILGENLTCRVLRHRAEGRQQSESGCQPSTGDADAHRLKVVGALFGNALELGRVALVRKGDRDEERREEKVKDRQECGRDVGHDGRRRRGLAGERRQDLERHLARGTGASSDSDWRLAGTLIGCVGRAVDERLLVGLDSRRQAVELLEGASDDVVGETLDAGEADPDEDSVLRPSDSLSFLTAGVVDRVDIDCVLGRAAVDAAKGRPGCVDGVESRASKVEALGERLARAGCSDRGRRCGK